MTLAPFASPQNTLFSGLPSTFAEKLDAGAVYQQVQVDIGEPIRDLDEQRPPPSAQDGVVGQGQSRSVIFSTLAIIPVVCRIDSLKRTLIVGQNWIAASEYTAGQPRPPSLGASQVISVSNKINSDLCLRSEAV